MCSLRSDAPGGLATDGSGDASGSAGRDPRSVSDRRDARRRSRRQRLRTSPNPAP